MLQRNLYIYIYIFVFDFVEICIRVGLLHKSVCKCCSSPRGQDWYVIGFLDINSFKERIDIFFKYQPKGDGQLKTT